MYAVSKNYENLITSDNRTFAVRVTFSSPAVLTGTTIQDITLDEIINSSDNLTMGCACSNKITVNLINPPTNIAYDETEFIAEVGLLIDEDYEWIPLGRFYATETETNNDFKTLKLIAYDGFIKMGDKYNATVSEETTLQAVYDDLKTQLHENCGITLKARELPDFTISNFPYLDITYTQAAAYVAGCLGEIARFDRNGELEFVWYQDNGQKIDRSLQYLNGFTRNTNNVLMVSSVSTGTKENPIIRSAGGGVNINFENPYITDDMADEIFNRVYGLTFTPCKLKWRGNPAFQAGDIVLASDKNGEDHTVLIMNRSLKVSGGCVDTVECKGTGEIKNVLSNGFETVGKKIERIYTNLETAILNATNAITGNKGGYVSLRDTNNDGKPDEILIMDLEDISLATKVWRWNKEGLGYAYNPAGNAYLGPYEIAITADGQINASFITTGTLSANRISVESYDGKGLLTDYIRFGDGSMTFGVADNAITLKLENDQVAFYNGPTRIAYFSNNSFEIENLTNGLIRFQNLEIMPRPSGNITFNIRK